MSDSVVVMAPSYAAKARGRIGAALEGVADLDEVGAFRIYFAAETGGVSDYTYSPDWRVVGSS